MPNKETTDKIFSLLPQSAKDKLVTELLSKYSDKISQMLTDTAKDHGIDMEVEEIEVKKI